MLLSQVCALKHHSSVYVLVPVEVTLLISVLPTTTTCLHVCICTSGSLITYYCATHYNNMLPSVYLYQWKSHDLLLCYPLQQHASMFVLVHVEVTLLISVLPTTTPCLHVCICTSGSHIIYYCVTHYNNLPPCMYL